MTDKDDQNNKSHERHEYDENNKNKWNIGRIRKGAIMMKSDKQ